jgi:hypothetical protein
MKKVILILILLAGTSTGYLYYDWYSITYLEKGQEYTYLYSWTDKEGQTHFSDNRPQADAQNLQTIEVIKQPGKPLLKQMHESISGLIYKTTISFAAMTNPENETTGTMNGISEKDPNRQITLPNRVERKWLRRKTTRKT